MRRIAAVVLVLCFMVCGRAYAAPGLPYYLALGDSLGRGTQPLPNGTLVDTNQGYVNGVYSFYRLTHPLLQVAKLGCSGESTTTMIAGGNVLVSARQPARAGRRLPAHASRAPRHDHDRRRRRARLHQARRHHHQRLSGARPGRGRPQPALHSVGAARGRGSERADRRDELLRPLPRGLGPAAGRPGCRRSPSSRWPIPSR